MKILLTLLVLATLLGCSEPNQPLSEWDLFLRKHPKLSDAVLDSYVTSAGAELNAESRIKSQQMQLYRIRSDTGHDIRDKDEFVELLNSVQTGHENFWEQFMEGIPRDATVLWVSLNQYDEKNKKSIQEGGYVIIKNGEVLKKSTMFSVFIDGHQQVDPTETELIPRGSIPTSQDM